MKTLFFQRALWVGLALTSTNIARADVQYTTQTSIAQDGALKPMSSVTTWLKTGLMRMDSSQTIGTYKSSETTISDKAKKQTITYNAALKMYMVEPLQAAGGNGGTSGGGATTISTAKAGVGTMILTVGAKFLGLEKMLNRPVRHYTTSMQSDSSGCCGTGKTSMKSEVWMADIQLPVFDAGGTGMDWKSAMGAAYSNCRINFQRKGDIKGYEAAQKGLALKTIAFDASGKPMYSSQITSLSTAPLTAAAFAVPAGFKKVTRDEYNTARSQAMVAAMTPKQDGDEESAQ